MKLVREQITVWLPVDDDEPSEYDTEIHMDPEMEHEFDACYVEFERIQTTLERMLAPNDDD